LIPVFAHFRPSSLPTLQRVDQLHVKKGDEQQRTTVYDDEVENVGVDDAVKSIAPESADCEYFACLVDSDAHSHALVLEEPLLLQTSSRKLGAKGP